MKKLRTLALTLAAALLVACSGSSASTTPSTSTTTSTGSETTTASADGVKIGDSGKIAVVRNLDSSDHTTQFFAGCVQEGNALGYIVDTYCSNADDAKMQDMMEQVIAKDYDIVVVSHANEGYQYDLVKKAVDSGKQVVCFDCAGEHVPGVTYTSQGDKEMADKCMVALTEKLESLGGKKPYIIGQWNVLGALVPFDLRGEKIQEWVDRGDIDMRLFAFDTADAYNSIYTQVTKLMNDHPDEPVGVFICAGNGSWITGCQDAIDAAGRDDVFYASIDISNEMIELVRNNTPTYLGIGCCDPAVVGIIDVRIGVLKTLGVETPETHNCTNVFVTADMLDADTTMTNAHFEGFGDSDDFKVEEIENLRAKFANAQ